MKIRYALLSVLLAAVVAPWSSGIQAAKVYDVLELPAVPSPLATKSLIYSIRQFGDRHFATGHRGHILWSDDGGDSWQQAEVPVRSAILDIYFPTPELGWAVGHEGVILHSSDGGKTWVKQYDGIRYGSEGLAYYQKLAKENPDNEDFMFLVEEMEFAVSQGADKPLFRIVMHNEKYGHALGAYGMVLRTEDGGQTWEPRLHTVENESFYHVFDFARLSGPNKRRFFLAGEAGLLMEADVSFDVAGSKRIHSVPWEGSFFTSIDTADQTAIVMGGLRGRMFRTEDVGHNWQVVEKPQSSAMVDSVRLANGDLVFVAIGGSVLISKDNGHSFERLDVKAHTPLFAVAEGSEGTLLLGGPKGIQKVAIPQ